MAEKRVGAIVAHERAETPPQTVRRSGPRTDAGKVGAGASTGTSTRTMTPEQTEDQQPARPRRRGRPPKVKEPESEFVEWWVAGAVAIGRPAPC